MVWQIPGNFIVYSTVSKLCVTGPLWGHWRLPWYSNAKNVSVSWNIVNLTATKSIKNFFLMNLLLKLSPAFSKFPSNYKFGGKLDILHKIRTLWSKKIWNNLIFTRLKKEKLSMEFWLQVDYKFFSEMVLYVKTIRLGCLHLDSYLGKCFLNLQTKCNRFKLHSCEHGSVKINVTAMCALHTYMTCN